MTTKTRRRVAAVAAAAALLSGLTAGPAWAHDVVLSSTPEHGSVIEQLPAEMQINLSAVPNENYNTMALSREGTVLFTDTPRIDGQSLIVAVPADTQAASEAGEYTLGFQFTSSDGHATRGRIDFTVAGESDLPPAAAENGSQENSAASTESSTVTNATNEGLSSEGNSRATIVAIAVGAVLATVLAGVLIARLTRRDR